MAPPGAFLLSHGGCLPILLNSGVFHALSACPQKFCCYPHKTTFLNSRAAHTYLATRFMASSSIAGTDSAPPSGMRSLWRNSTFAIGRWCGSGKRTHVTSNSSFSCRRELQVLGFTKQSHSVLTSSFLDFPYRHTMP